MFFAEERKTSARLLRNNIMKEPIILNGKVVRGKALGRTVGMPTANLQIFDAELPKSGVYATRIRIGGELLESVTNIGTRPSVDCETYHTVETHILDFDRDIYGEDVTLEVIKFLRPIQKFNNLQEVQGQVRKDILRAKIYFQKSEEES